MCSQLCTADCAWHASGIENLAALPASRYGPSGLLFVQVLRLLWVRQAG
jgi:hypothetical protein